ncbi:MBL fold metallo-hydrolase [Clostridia bacterium]|nr:MBL fold metallo-hydrolase [Clostridia bacterium]
MIFKQFKLSALQNNSFVFGDENTNEVAIVDAPRGSEEMVEFIKNKDYTVKYIFLTHTHFDHIDGIPTLRTAFPNAEFIRHKDELDVADCTEINGDESLKIGDITAQTIFTPGHTYGGICLYIEDKLLSGDTLFYEEVGRADLVGGNLEQLISGIREKLFVLPDDTRVYPGHGWETTIGHEKAHNPYCSI